MPYAIRYIAPTETGPEIGALSLNESLERQHRSRWIRRRRDAYEGKFKDLLSGADLHVPMNPVRYAIIADIYRNMGLTEENNPTSIRFDVIKEGESALVNAAPAIVTESDVDEDQAFLNRVWDNNSKLAFIFDLLLVASVTGHGFVKIVPNGVVNFETNEPLPRLVVLDPELVTVFWSATDVGTPLWYRIRIPDMGAAWTGSSTTTQYIVEDHVLLEDGSWAIYTYLEQGNKATLLDSYVSEYPMIVDFQNARNPFMYYGESDITENIIQQIETANHVATNMAAIIQNHAHPKTIGVGIAASQVQATAVDGLWTIPNEKANIYNLEMASDLSSSREFLASLVENVYGELREVLPTLGGRDLTQVTNFAVRVLYAPSLQKTSAKRFVLSPVFKKLNALIFLHAGKPYTKVETIFPSPLSTDPAAQTAALSMDVQVGGLSKHTYLMSRGYNPAYEEEHKKDEQEQAIEFAKKQMEATTPPQPAATPPNQDNRTKKKGD